MLVTVFRKLKWVLLLLGLPYCPASGQYYNQQQNFLKANSVWAFGNSGAGLDFNGGSPMAIRTAPMASFPNRWGGSTEGCASVSDSTGQLLFYLSNCGTIYNRNHKPMLNGNYLYPSNATSGSSTQGALIIPVIDTPWKYYVFTNPATEDAKYGISPPYLAYSVVDMTLDNNDGGVEPMRKNIPLYNYFIGEGMIAIPGEDCDIWLLARTANYLPQSIDPSLPGGDTAIYFLAWHITRSGIDLNPVVSSPYSWCCPRGSYMAVSPNRKRIAITNFGHGCDNALLYKFDPVTGILSEELPFGDEIGNYYYSVCFSPDNTKLYLSAFEDRSKRFLIKQYDISVYDLPSIRSSEYLVSEVRNTYSALKLYGDKIYTSANPDSIYSSRFEFLSRINSPNAPGAACNYQANAIPLLEGTQMNLGLPNEVVFPIQIRPSIVYDTICYSKEMESVTKTISAPAGFASYEWDNGSTAQIREVTASGTYWVKYQNSCPISTDTFYIEAVDLTFSLGEDKTMLFCDQPSSYLRLEVNIPDVVYRWQDGSTNNRFRVTGPDTYWVEVSKGGCVASDTIMIEGVKTTDLSDTTFCKGDEINIMLYAPDVSPGTIIQWSTGSTASFIQVRDTGLYWFNLINPPCILSDSAYIKVEICECFTGIPNAFTPNGDGINDYFLPVIEQGCLVKGYALSVYNRFGERVFFSTDPKQSWDGYYKGNPAEVGTYFHEVHFAGGTRGKAYYFKGDVVLIR